jgi:hypothetical protein
MWTPFWLSLSSTAISEMIDRTADSDKMDSSKGSTMPIVSIAIALLAISPVDVGAPEAAKSQKPVCKVFQVTGSLVRKRRVCYSQKEWSNINSRDREAAERFVESNRGLPPGGE